MGCLCLQGAYTCGVLLFEIHKIIACYRYERFLLADFYTTGYRVSVPYSIPSGVWYHLETVPPPFHSSEHYTYVNCCRDMANADSIHTLKVVLAGATEEA